MRHFVYYITNSDCTVIHVGMCSDLKRANEFYQEMPTLFFEPGKVLNKMIYCCYFDNDKDFMMQEFKRHASLTNNEKMQLALGMNPELIDISTAPAFPFNK